jgi:polar amino acid transport system ATP-binding protein
MSGTTPTPLIELQGVSKWYGELNVLKSVDLAVHKTEVVCIIGPSGSGKSTLLRCMNFLEEYQDGEVRVNGQLLGYRIDSKGRRVMDSVANINAVRRDIAMVFQHFNLWPHITTLQNVAQPLRLVLKKSRADAEAAAMQALTKVGLGQKATSYPGQLSGGQQQRVGIARALAINPQVILFDEPTSSLDPELVGEVLQVIRELAAEGLTMVIVTHEMGFAAQVAGRVVFVDEGVVIEEGAPAVLFRDPKSPRLSQFLQTWKERSQLFHEGAE